MSYEYKRLPPDQIEVMAVGILERFPNRINGLVVDVEGILEDLGLTIIPRRGGLRKYAEGYTPKDWRFIVVAEEPASYPPRYRPIVAEELCHIILEYDLWKLETLPTGADGHELTADQHRDIESDAVILADAIILPKTEFTARFSHHQQSLKGLGADPDKMIKRCVEQVAVEFEVWELVTARRARFLGLITPEQQKRIFSDKILF